MRDIAVDVLMWLLNRLVDLLVVMVMLGLVVLLAFLSVGCASVPPARHLPALPPAVNLGQLVGPPPPPFAAPAHARRYPDTAIRAGQCGPGAPPGILVSPAVYAESTAAVSEARRLRTENGALASLHKSDRSAAEDLAQACRAQVAELAVAVDRAERVSAWRAAGILVAGIALGLVPGYLLGQAAGLRW